MLSGKASAGDTRGRPVWLGGRDQSCDLRGALHVLGDAAAHGDRSENAEYIYGKKRLREIDSRLHFLRKRMDDLVIVRSNPEQEGKVFFGAWVTLEEEDGSKHRYRLVGPDEFDAKAGLISLDSPMGRALIGRELGDEVVVRRPKGDAHYSVEAIEYHAPQSNRRDD